MHKLFPFKVRKGSLLALLLCLSALLIPGCKKKEVHAAVASQSDPMEVSVTPAIAENLQIGVPEMHEISGTLEVSARVEADARRIARVGSPVSGRILNLLVFEGQNVRAGSVLATLHSTDLSQAQLALVKAHTQQGVDQAAAQRAEQLVAADVMGKAELERRRAEMQQTDAEAASYRTQLRGLGMGEVQIRQLENTSKLNAEYPIVAPRAGTVLERKIAIGQVIQPADAAFTIADLSAVRIVANVPEEEGSTLRRGMPVTVHIPALPEVKLEGQLSYVAPVVDPETRTVEVRMDVPNRDGLYKPDELASMTFNGRANKELTVPATAVVREENKDYVFVQMAPARFKMREVTLGEEQGDLRVVRGGVTASEHIVTNGAFHLNNQRKQNAIKGGE